MTIHALLSVISSVVERSLHALRSVEMTQIKNEACFVKNHVIGRFKAYLAQKCYGRNLEEHHRKRILPFLGEFVLHSSDGGLEEECNQEFV